MPGAGWSGEAQSGTPKKAKHQVPRPWNGSPSIKIGVTSELNSPGQRRTRGGIFSRSRFHTSAGSRGGDAILLGNVFIAPQRIVFPPWRIKSYAILLCFASFPSGIGNPERDEAIFKMLMRSMEAASILGVRNIVVHPLKWIDVLENREEAWKANTALYERLIPYCEKLKLCVCVENMKKYNRQTRKFDVSFCGDPDTFCGFIDAIDSPYIKACLDVGHAALAGTDPAEFIRRLGPKRLHALHIHDVDDIDDRHNLPFQEDLDWESICRALGEIGYKGWFTLEADNFMKHMPPALWPDAEIFMAKTARYLADRVEQYAIKAQ